MAQAEERFWLKVNKTDTCWLWTGSNHKGGYGQAWYRGRLQGAHRISYILNVSEIPEGLHVLHRCDNPPCVNPDHLFVGTNADNIADKIAKGRQWHRPIKTICNRGHRFTEENTYMLKGRKYCRQCNRINSLATYHRLKGVKK